MSSKGDKIIISEGCVVTIHYTLTNDAGDILDTSSGQEPMTYLHGCGGMIPGLEFALEEKSVGDTLTVDLAPNEGYGPVNPELIHDVPIGALAQIENLEVRMQLQSKDDEGRDVVDHCAITRPVPRRALLLAGRCFFPGGCFLLFRRRLLFPGFRACGCRPFGIDLPPRAP